MAERPISLPKDAGLLGEMIATSFQYPENPAWSVQTDEKEGLADMVAGIRRLWPLIRIAQVFTPSLRHLLRGYFWEEEGRTAGIVIAQPRGKSRNWMVTTVATHPDFRRRGIARKLVNAILAFVRREGGRQVALDVIAGNLPAYKLYESVGFRHFTSMFELEIPTPPATPAPQFPDGYRLLPLDMMDWQTRYDLEKRIVPAAVQEFETVDPARFQQPGIIRLIMPLINRIQGTRMVERSIQHIASGQTVGRMLVTARTKPGGRHNLAARLDPAHAHLAPALLAGLLHEAAQGSAGQIIQMTVMGWQPELLAAAHAAGFKTRIEFHRMGLTLPQAGA